LLLGILGGVGLLAHPASAACGIQRAATLPLLSTERPVVQVAINGLAVQMLVDTGSQISMVTPDAVAALRLARDLPRGSRIQTLGGEAVSRNAILTTLEIAGLQYNDRSVAVSALDGTKTDSGSPPAGVIGADLLHDFDLELDIRAQTLTLYRPDPCAPSRPTWNEPYVRVSATVSGRNQLLFPVTLNGHTLQAVFDTGSRGETVSRDAANDLGVTDQDLLHDPTASGISSGQHDYRIRRHLFTTMKIGSELFRNVPLDVVDFHQPGIDMLVGADYMHWRRFYLAYSANALFIQKVKPGPDPHAPPVAAAPGNDGCQAPSDLLASLSHSPLVVVSEKRLDPPDAARTAHIDGCVGVLFRLTADGVPWDLKVVAEQPPRYGLGAYVVQEIAAARFEPSPDTGWHYEVQRVDLSHMP
jgi:predicted aspartyl protease